MIEYPRIFSLSTVGVRKHYNQDYLLHQVRTDFTGNNGIGKSLIADLFQLIFIVCIIQIPVNLCAITDSE